MGRLGSRFGGLSGLLVLAGMAAAQVDSDAYAIETISGHQGAPTNVELHQTDVGLVLRGEVRKSPANPSRRMYGRVAVEYLDAAGQVLGTTYTDVYRTSPARHAYRAAFQVPLDDLPAGTRAVRVGYR